MGRRVLPTTRLTGIILPTAALAAALLALSAMPAMAQCVGGAPNGVLESGEACDDGNSNNDDGCTNLCHVKPFCGDSIVQPPETCDDGNDNDFDQCRNDCSFCGDGKVDASEECDDGNNDDGDGCSASCEAEGKTFDIGPSSMEGHLKILPGDWISGGYSFKFVDGSHAASTVTVSSTLTVPFRCADGATGQFVIGLGTHDYPVPAKNTDWQPTGDANSVLSWAGSGQAPAGCGPGQIMDNSKGAIFESTVSQNPDTGSLLNWRFKYRDPNAKGKGNVNCLDTSDPRRNKADVCGASWSGTVRDP